MVTFVRSSRPHSISSASSARARPNTGSARLWNFADSASSFAPRPLPNTAANVAMAKRYLEGLRASGGTNQLAGIAAALRAPGDSERQRSIVFMTDGYIGNEASVIAMVEWPVRSVSASTSASVASGRRFESLTTNPAL